MVDQSLEELLPTDNLPWPFGNLNNTNQSCIPDRTPLWDQLENQKGYMPDDKPDGLVAHPDKACKDRLFPEL